MAEDFCRAQINKSFSSFDEWKSKNFQLPSQGTIDPTNFLGTVKVEIHETMHRLLSVARTTKTSY